VTLACGPGHHGKEKAWDKAWEAASIEGASENDQQQFYDRSEQREDASLRERPLAADCPSPHFCPALKSTDWNAGENLIC